MSCKQAIGHGHRAEARTGRGITAAVAILAASGILATTALAQQPAPKAEPKAKAAPKAQPKEAPAQPQQPPQGQQAQQAPQPPQLTFTPWTKVCQKPPEAGANPKQICFTGRDGRIENGMPIVAAVLIEPEGEPRKLLRVTLPLGMALAPGTRVVIDQGQPITGPYVICMPNGCMADYEASGELIGKLKSGQNLHVQGVNGAGQPMTLTIPLADFAKANEGPATDPAALIQQQQQQAQQPQAPQPQQQPPAKPQ